MIVHITGKTDRFNLSVVGSDFINDGCFGEDFSHWLVSVLSEVGVRAHVIGMEDFGWANQAEYGDVVYLLNVGATPEGDSARPDFGEWHVLLQRQRSFRQRLFGQNKDVAADPVLGKVVGALQAAGFMDVQIES